MSHADRAKETAAQQPTIKRIRIISSTMSLIYLVHLTCHAKVLVAVIFVFSIVFLFFHLQEYKELQHPYTLL